MVVFVFYQIGMNFRRGILAFEGLILSPSAAGLLPLSEEAEGACCILHIKTLTWMPLGTFFSALGFHLPPPLNIRHPNCLQVQGFRLNISAEEIFHREAFKDVFT